MEYKRTLIFARSCFIDKTIIWIEGDDFVSPVPDGFGIVGGGINTNTGASFTKTMLQEIVNNMSYDSKFRVAGCNSLDIKSVKEEFIKINNFITTKK